MASSGHVPHSLFSRGIHLPVHVSKKGVEFLIGILMILMALEVSLSRHNLYSSTSKSCFLGEGKTGAGEVSGEPGKGDEWEQQHYPKENCSE